jgi:hypothetical protein
MDRERIVPSCCDKSRNARVVLLGYNEDVDGRTEDSPPKWLVVGKNSDGFTVIEQALFCPFCGKNTPALRKKRTKPTLVMRVTDGGYYCDTCGERVIGCECARPEECWEEKGGHHVVAKEKEGRKPGSRGRRGP